MVDVSDLVELCRANGFGSVTEAVTVARTASAEIEQQTVEIERLRANLAREVAQKLADNMDAADEIQRLQQECMEQARLLGMSGSREADLRGQIERLRYALAIYVHAYDHGASPPVHLQSEAKALVSKTLLTPREWKEDK